MCFIPPTDSDPTKEQSKIEHDVTPCNLIPCCFELKHILTLGKDQMHLHKRQGCYANKEQEFLPVLFNPPGAPFTHHPGGGFMKNWGVGWGPPFRLEDPRGWMKFDTLLGWRVGCKLN